MSRCHVFWASMAYLGVCTSTPGLISRSKNQKEKNGASIKGLVLNCKLYKLICVLVGINMFFLVYRWHWLRVDGLWAECREDEL